MSTVATVKRSFPGGVHPEEHKALSEHQAIETLALPKRLYVPLHQHLGRPCEPCVSTGDLVRKGDLVGVQQGFVSAPVHAPTSGVVVGIEEHTVGHPSGLTLPCVVIDSDGKDQWREDMAGLEDPLHAEPEAIRDKIRDSGIVGLGGATFPSYIKMTRPKDKVVDLLILNGVECEPYLTCDARLMEEKASEIIEGVRIMLRALKTKECIIGIEDNKPAAIRTMRDAAAGSASSSSIRVMVMPVMYPQGSEKQLIEVITGKQVPSGGLPLDVGVIVHNVATALAIRDAVSDGKPLISRVVTVTGGGIKNSANLDVLLGTPVQTLIDHCNGLRPGTRRVVMGGPMMGVALHTMETPVVKATSGILALLASEITESPERPCIRCAHCVQACPMSLMPTEMAWLSRHDLLDKLEEYDLFDCIECGSCAFVCPSNIPLVHYFRYGKMAIQAREHEKKIKERDKKRTQQKDVRAARAQAERERKKAEMKAKMAAKKKAAAAAKAAESVSV